VRFLLLLLCLGVSASCRVAEPAARPAQLVVWAWERPEDLRFLPAGVEVAVQTGFVEISGGVLRARGRRFPLKTNAPPATAVVHVEIDPRRVPQWTPTLRRRTAAAVLHYAQAVPAGRVQVDFEVVASQRGMLLDLLADVRAGLPETTRMSMTALASWCDTEDWLGSAPVDEIVPMLFRMQLAGERLRKRLAQGQDFRNPRCRGALAVSTDSPIVRAPAGRRVYLFNPRSWTAEDFRDAQRMVEGWR
jgi:hypothetical protein